jgi:hypothetical protein
MSQVSTVIADKNALTVATVSLTPLTAIIFIEAKSNNRNMFVPCKKRTKEPKAKTIPEKILLTTSPEEYIDTILRREVGSSLNGDSEDAEWAVEESNSSGADPFVNKN